MSESYKHLLIPLSAEYRPEPNAIAKFSQRIIENGNVAGDFVISFARITKGQRALTARNPTTGKTLSIPRPTRRAEKPETLASTAQIIELASSQREYDVVI